jgi:hypothetical protein
MPPEPADMRADAGAFDRTDGNSYSAIWSISAEGGGCHVAADCDIARPMGAAYAGLPPDRWDPQRAGLLGLSPAARCPMTAAAPSTALAAIPAAGTDGPGAAAAVEAAGSGHARAFVPRGRAAAMAVDGESAAAAVVGC